ncbi:MAG: PKD domain-containing protein [Candidatus Thermoplasmatota archaeon]|nr:PKD domain-containing protein [Candidatus Thermoplasmatota archaeon]
MDHVGLFGTIGPKATVKNVNILDQNITGGDHVGGLVGTNYGTVTNGYSDGTTSGYGHIGGLIGNNQGIVRDCCTAGTTSGGYRIGGLVGGNYGTVENSCSDGTASGDSRVGGLVGYNFGPITFSYATGTTTGKQNWGEGGIGGLVGFNDGWTVSYCYSTGNTSGNSCIGGLVGTNYGTVKESYSTGTTTGMEEYTGGLIGYNTGSIMDSYAHGITTGMGDYVGGFVGCNYGSILNSYATGSIIGVSDYVGGFVGYYNWGWVNNSFWDINASGKNTSSGGTGKTTFEMRSRTTFTDAGWDFLYVWFIIDNITYPILKWQDSIPPNASAGYDMMIDEGTNITFNGSESTDNFLIVKYSWTFKDRTTIVLYGDGPTYQFNNPGVFDVTLKVTDIAGNWDTDKVTVTVMDLTKPIIDAGPDRIVDEGTVVIFDGSLCYDNGVIMNWTWTFFDGERKIALYGSMPTHIFDDPGMFIVTLNVTDAGCNWDTDTMTVTVLDTEAPIADAGPDQMISMGETAQFNASLSADNVGIIRYTWKFTDGVPITLIGSIQSHWFENAGVFEVTLNVSDAAGKWAVDTMTVTVWDTEPPIAIAGEDLVIDEGQRVTFDAGSSSDNVGIINYSWSFSWWNSYDDLITIRLYGSKVEYQFNNPGLFIVQLAVYDAAYNLATTTVNVTVRDITSPIAEISLHPSQMLDRTRGLLLDRRSFWTVRGPGTTLGSSVIHGSSFMMDQRELLMKVVLNSYSTRPDHTRSN